MKLAVTYPDVERAVVDLLADLLADEDPVPTVGVGVPTSFAVGAQPHVQVALDGSVGLPHPIAERSTVRVTVWHPPTSPSGRGSTTAAKALAQLARGLLLAETGDTVAQVLPGAGMFPAYDEDTRAELASFTVLVTMRSVPIAG